MTDESPLISSARKVYNKLADMGATKDVPAKKDTTDYKWHEDMVKSANESHAKNEKKSTKKKAYRK